MHTGQSALNESPKQARQIILCCDGTNNTLTGSCHDTNVLKIIGQLVPEEENQVLYYDPGVGAPDQLPTMSVLNDAHRIWERLAGLVNGKGIYENISEAYLFLVERYQPGDQIYIFGFSRGAFTARCVAGMVNLFGIVRTDSKPLILTLIRVYFSTPADDKADRGWWGGLTADKAIRRKKENDAVVEDTKIASFDATEKDITSYLARTKARRSTRAEVAKQVKREFTSPAGATAAVHFIGVWDTVESVGFPLKQRSITSDGHTMHKEGLRHIRHALSMDENRWTFAPRLYWDEDYDLHDASNPANSRSLRQRWFRGVHSDIGGGYDINEAGLSDESYRWMLNEAIACGLRTVPKQEKSEHLPKPYIAHDACYETPWWGVAGLTVRSNVTHRDGKKKCGVPVITEGAASDSSARVYPVWKANVRLAHWQTWVAAVCMLVLAALYGWTGAAAMGRQSDVAVLSSIGTGWTGLESWKLTYFLQNYTSVPVHGPTSVAVTSAVLATIVDFGLIIAYSWLVGLYATWAFHAMVGLRNPAARVSPLVKLGYAPMLLVLADVAENIFTFITLWGIAQPIEPVAIVASFLMMTACVFKWLGLVGTAALLVCGIASKVNALGAAIGPAWAHWKSAIREKFNGLRQPARTASPPVRHRRGWPG